MKNIFLRFTAFQRRTMFYRAKKEVQKRCDSLTLSGKTNLCFIEENVWLCEGGTFYQFFLCGCESSP